MFDDAPLAPAPRTADAGTRSFRWPPCRLAAQLDSELSLDALYEQYCTEAVRVRLAGISSWSANRSHVRLRRAAAAAPHDGRCRRGIAQITASVHYCRPTIAARALYMSDAHMIGLNVLGAVRTLRGLSVGGELLYSAEAEAPGGASRHRPSRRASWPIDGLAPRGRCAASLGARFVNEHSLATATLSPISGHLTATFASRLAPRLIAATRYEYNIHSTFSDVAFGIAYEPPGTPYTLRLRFSTASGIGALLEANIARALVSAGINCPLEAGQQPHVGLHVRLQ